MEKMIMRKIIELPRMIEDNDGNMFHPIIYVTVFDKWCISYENIQTCLNLFSVVIEPDKEIFPIEQSIGTINERIGDAPTFDDAIKMINEYISKNFKISR